MSNPETAAAGESSISARAAVAVPGGSRRALATLALLFVMNLLDYADRWVLAAVLPQARTALDLDESQAAWLVFWFLLAYMAVCPVAGYLGDRVRRTWLIGGGFALAALATLATGLARNHGELRLARVALGAGKAAFGALAPTILVDLFPRSWRGRVLGAFCLALPLGGALGTAVGGYFAARSTWSHALFALALPGLIASAAVFLLPEPLRGATEPVAPERVAEHQKAGPTQEDYIDMMVNSSFTYSVFGMAFFTFAMAGMAAWLPRFLIVQKGFPADTVWRLGWVTLASSTLGILLGGWLGDLLSRRSGRAYFMLSGLALLGSIPCLIAAVHGRTETVVYAALFLTVALMFVHAGPCLAVVANVVAPNMRGVGFAVALFSAHLFGDLWSPSLMGWVSDTFGRRDAMSTPFGAALAAVGAVPTAPPGGAPENLTAAMLVVVPALALSGGVLLAGARHLPRESALMLANLRASPKRKAQTRPGR